MCAQTHSLHASSLGLDSNRYAKSCRPLFRLDSVLHLSSVEENVVFFLKMYDVNSNNTFVVLHFISCLLLREKLMQELTSFYDCLHLINDGVGVVATSNNVQSTLNYSRFYTKGGLKQLLGNCRQIARDYMRKCVYPKKANR